MLEFGRLLDLLRRLPPGSRLTTTTDGAESLGCSLSNASLRQARRVVTQAGFHTCDAEYDATTQTILVYRGLRWISWPLFSVVLPSGSEKGPSDEQHPLT